MTVTTQCSGLVCGCDSRRQCDNKLFDVDASLSKSAGKEVNRSGCSFVTVSQSLSIY